MVALTGPRVDRFHWLHDACQCDPLDGMVGYLPSTLEMRDTSRLDGITLHIPVGNDISSGGRSAVPYPPRVEPEPLHP